MSTTPLFGRTVTRWLPLLLAAEPGCGWQFGAGPASSFVVGQVTSVAVEPGLEAAVRGAMVRSLRERGVGADGPVAEVRILSVDHTPEAAPVGGGTVAWRTAIALQVDVRDRPGCSIVVRRSDVWFDPGGRVEGYSAARADALEGLARSAADAAVDRLLWSSQCR